MPETIKHSSCPLCVSENIAEHLSCADNFVTGEVFPVFRCSDCGFIFTNDYPPESEIGSYYKSEEYISHSDTDSGLINKLYHLARAIMLRRKWRILKSQTRLSNGKLLDIGCGTGYFPHYMSKKGWLVSGIEKDEKARNFATSRLNIEVFNSDKIFHLDEKAYDCITLWHVLEHFHDPDSVIKAAGMALKESGIIVIALPNNRSYDSIHYSDKWAAWDVPRHLWHFNPETIKLFLKKHGMGIVAVKRLPLDAFYVSMLSEKYKGARFPMVSGLFYGKISLLKSLWNKNLSSSLIYIFKRVEA